MDAFASDGKGCDAIANTQHELVCAYPDQDLMRVVYYPDIQQFDYVFCK